MQAIRVRFSLPRFALCKLLGGLYRPVYYGPLSPLVFGHIPEPSLPDPNWVKIRTRLGGICATDLSGILLQLRPDSFMGAFLSFPIGVGHEAVGYVHEVGPAVSTLKPGDRVTLDPSLSCVTRSINPPCENCRDGRYNTCTNFAEGALPPGCGVGGNNRTGGSWGEFFVAHKDRVFLIPDDFSDALALFIEPFSCALHAVRKLTLHNSHTVLVFGAGTLGLMTVAALRLLDFRGRILVAARYPFQAQAARSLGADLALPPSGQSLYTQLADLTGARIYRGRLGNNRTLVGGVDAVFDWVGSTQSITDSLRFLKAGGHMVLGGIDRPKNVDWTPLWAQECVIHGSASHATEDLPTGRVFTFNLAIDLLRTHRLNLEPLLTHTFPLHQYPKAFDTLLHKERTHAVKVAFQFPAP